MFFIARRKRVLQPFQMGLPMGLMLVTTQREKIHLSIPCTTWQVSAVLIPKSQPVMECKNVIYRASFWFILFLQMAWKLMQPMVPQCMLRLCISLILHKQSSGSEDLNPRQLIVEVPIWCASNLVTQIEEVHQDRHHLSSRILTKKLSFMELENPNKQQPSACQLRLNY